MKKTIDHTKARGGYYTPKDLTDLIVNWVKPLSNESILEPSCGDGAFLESLSEYSRRMALNGVNVTAIELDPKEAQKSSAFFKTINSDFFTYYNDHMLGCKKYDILLGNPPFIRYQSFKEEFRTVAFRLMNDFGFHPSRMTNIWVPFLILASEVLSENGRIGMVIPAELFQVNYARDARNYLMSRFQRLTILMLNSIIFEGAQQEVVILLGEVKSSNPGFFTVSVNNISQLEGMDHTFISEFEYRRPLLDNEKWTRYYLTNDDLELISRIEGSGLVVPGSQLFEINVGVVTGENNFFIIDKDVIEQYGITSCCPIVCGTDYLPGLFYTEVDSQKNYLDKKSMLFNPSNISKESLDSGDCRYIEYGESMKYNAGYKCRIRDPWYTPPISWVPEGFFFRQVGRYPRIVLNQCGALTTDTLHKVRFKTGYDAAKVAVALFNSYTLSQCELIGRSYGGGVLTFEPSEVRRIPIPISNMQKLDPDLADLLIRENNIDQLITINDKILLKDGMGLTSDEIAHLNSIWCALCNRRESRKVRKMKRMN